MSRRVGGSWILVVLATIASSVAPADWLLWTKDLADVVRAPVMPVSRLGTSIASWLRPPLDLEGRPVSEQEIGQLREDRDRFEYLWQSQRLRADDLARRLRQLQGLPDSVYRGAHPPLVADALITGRDPSDPRSPIELRVPDEGADRIQIGDIVVWNGSGLIGRLSHVSSVRLVVLPLSNPEAGPLEVALADNAEGDRLIYRMLLRQQDDGSLSADIDRRVPVEAGDRLVLADSRWPAWSQGLDVAVIQDVTTIDEAPLRHRLIARPAVDAPSVARVAILSAAESDSQ